MPKRERTHLLTDARAERRAQRRAQLLESARAAIRRDGPATSMEVIAAEAGVTKPIVYKHFGDRDGLSRALSDEFVDRLVQEITRSLHQDAQPSDLLRTTIDTYLAFVEADPHVYRFLVHQAKGGGDVVPTLSGVMVRVGREVAIVLGEQLRAAGLDSGPAEPWAFGIVGMVHLAGDWWLDQRTMTRERLVEYLTALLWQGLSGAPTAVAGAAVAAGARSTGDE